jgi:hypothetical protein
MERTAPEPPKPRRRKADARQGGRLERPPHKVPAALPEDDRFAPHPGGTIDAVYVIARGFELILARPRPVLAVMLASVVLSGLLVAALVALGLAENPLWAAAGIDGVMHPASVMVLLVLGWACALLLQTPLVGSAIEVHTRRRGLDVEFLRRGVARLPDLIVSGLAVLGISVVVLVVAVLLQLVVVTLTAFVPWLVVVVMLRFACLVAIVVVALRVITAFALVIPVIVVEQLPARDALRRAWALGWPNGLPLLLAFLLPALVVQGVLYVLGFLPWFISIPANLVLGVGLALYESVLVPVAYVAIREYVDGLDPERLVTRGRR